MRGKLENCFCLKSEKQPEAELVAAKSLTKIRLQHQWRRERERERESRAALIAGINLELQNIPNLFLSSAWSCLVPVNKSDLTLSLAAGVTAILVTLFCKYWLR